MLFEEIETNQVLENWERRFVKKVVPSDTKNYCTAYCLINDICLLYATMNPSFVIKLEYSDNVSAVNSGVTGKKKKGSTKVMRGEVICKLTYQNGTVVELRSPIAGNIIEFNSIPLVDISVLNNERGEGYLIVIHRNKVDEIKLELCGNNSDKVPRSNICFDFIKGTCKRGDLCRYEHMQLNSDGSLVKANSQIDVNN